MVKSSRVSRIVGLILHVLIAGLLIFSGTFKVLGLLPPEAAEGLAKYGLTGKIQLIGAGELITALLLLIPRTSSLGVLLASALWGGAICLHMTHDEPYVFQSCLLILTWVGAFLREPLMFSSFWGDRGVESKPVGLGE
jgi:hypothetical protein